MERATNQLQRVLQKWQAHLAREERARKQGLGFRVLGFQGFRVFGVFGGFGVVRVLGL